MAIGQKTKRLLVLVAIPVIGAILLNLTFIADFLFQTAIDRIFGIDYATTMQTPPVNKHLLFLILILIISWLIFRAKRIGDFIKALYSIVPVAVLFATIGILLYSWPVIIYVACTAIYLVLVLYLFLTKKSWMYYYSISLVALILLVMSLYGVQI